MDWAWFNPWSSEEVARAWHTAPYGTLDRVKALDRWTGHKRVTLLGTVSPTGELWHRVAAEVMFDAYESIIMT